MYNEHGYKVVENVLDTDDYNNIKEYLNNVSWNFIPSTVSGEVKPNSQDIHKSSLVHIIKCLSEKKPSIEKYQIAKPLINCLDKFFNVREVIRIRAGLILPKEKEIEHGCHVDFIYPHHTALFYFSTEKNAGETYVYDQKFDPYKYESVGENVDRLKDKMKVIEKVEAKENRALFFQGNVFHSSSTPKTVFKRIAVNVNFRGHPKEV